MRVEISSFQRKLDSRKLLKTDVYASLDSGIRLKDESELYVLVFIGTDHSFGSDDNAEVTPNAFQLHELEASQAHPLCYHFRQ